MGPIEIGAVAVVAILILAFLGAPIGAAVGLVAACGIVATSNFMILAVNLQTLPYATAAEYAFIVVPMFVLMGNVAASAGIIESMFESAAKWLGRVRGGLLIAVTLASGGFAAVSGSTIVNAAVFTRMAYPQMIKQGYDKNISAAFIAASGTFAVMIPPSLSFVLYGIMTGESVGKLFIAGIIPGLITIGAYVVAVLIGVRLRPNWAPQSPMAVPLREKVRSLSAVWPIAILVTLVLGGIYTGFMAPSAAGGVGAVGAVLISIAYRRFTLRGFWSDVLDAAMLTSTIFFIIISGFLFSRFMITSGFVPVLVSTVSGVGVGPMEFLLIMVFVDLVLGMFLDGATIAVITLPFVYPIARELGIDGIWFGVLFVKLVEMGAITPPIGLNLFAVIASSRGELNLVDLTRGIGPLILIEFVVLGILLALPGLSTWLPSTM